jgi:putative aminopeptidase FrvX
VAVPELLRALLTTPGPSGHEREVARVWREAAREFAEVATDRLGSSVARVRGRGDGPLLAVVAHVDEIGLAITRVRDDGLLDFRTLGGWSRETLWGQRVEILGRAGIVPGLVGTRDFPAPPAGEARGRVELRDYHLDVGARSREEAEALVRPGDAVVLASEPLELPNDRLASRALDNRVGVYVALEALRRLAGEGGAPGDVAAVAVVGEEVGDYSGARTAAYGLRPDVAIVLDVTQATDVPDADPRTRGAIELGGGPAIGRGSPLHPRVSELLFESAEAEGIVAGTEVSAGATDTDADAVHMSGAGVPTGLVSIPLRYLHTPNELVSLDDVEAAVRLVAAFARRLEPGTSFEP